MQWLVTGASGKLGGYLLRELQGRGADVVAWSGSRTGESFGVLLRPVDLGDADRVAEAFRSAAPDVVVHAGAMALVSDCFRAPERADRVNRRATEVLAELAGGRRARLVFLSTDLVFDGKHAPYGEESPAVPLSVYGRTKLAAEETALRAGHAALRVSLLFGPSLNGAPSFFDDQVAALRERRPVRLFEDEWRTPLSLQTAARAVLSVARSDCTGLLHVGGPERLSRLEMGRRLAAALTLDASVLVAARRDQVPAGEPRPRDTSLDSSRWRRLFPREPWPNWDEALRELGLALS
jgi:dTDP-4-dehydrorhamnose reductase